ncbi:MAG: 50S ribosomal protein L16 [Dehalococcoidales bacterium]|nr:50S ribosomal protein L16 [Dehalococcoidales bacterium]
MEQPKRVKYRKMHKDRRRGSAHAGNTLEFGDYGMQALGSAWVTSRQIEAARRTITHYFRRGGKVWIRVFPDKPITKKPAETRMGSGKGAPDHWVAVVKRGRIIFELADISEAAAKEATRLASNKLPLDVKFITRTAVAVGVGKEEEEKSEATEGTQGEH